MKWYYADPKTCKPIIFTCKSRESAIKRIEKITKEPRYAIDYKLKSDLQLGVTMSFNI